MLLKLFRQDAVRIWDPLTDQVKRVKKDHILPLGARILLPKKKEEEEEEPAGACTISPTPSSKLQIVQQHDAIQATTALLIDHLRRSVLIDCHHFLALNKPAGVPVQGGVGVAVSIDALLSVAFPTHNSNSTITRTTKLSSSSSSSQDNGDLKLVHRLDKDVSGVLLVAKGRRAAAKLSAAFQGKSLAASGSSSSSLAPPSSFSGKINTTTSSKSTTKHERSVGNYKQKKKEEFEILEKVYWAVVVCSSTPQEEENENSTNFSYLNKGKKGTIRAVAAAAAVVEEQSNSRRGGGADIRKKSGEAPHSQRHHRPPVAVTKYKVLADTTLSSIKDSKSSNTTEMRMWLLELQPITGRKHQLRQHCATELGVPILGDSKYGTIRKEPQKSILKNLLSFRSEDSNNATTTTTTPLFLHCRSIKMNVPGMGVVRAVAPLPAVWERLFEMQGW